MVRRAAVIAALLLGACGDDGGSDSTTSTSGGSSSGGSSATSATASTSMSGGSDAATGTSATSSDSSSTSTTGDATSGEGTGGSSGTTGSAFSCADGFPTWPDGTMCPEPAISAWRLGPNTYVLRQSLCTSFEGPFMYMLFGDDYVLLEDTGDGGIPITTAVSDIIDEWLAERGQESIELIVANSHAHGDHVQGNAALSTLPYATLVGTSISDVSSFFAISDWPNDVGSVDLGGRVLDIIPIPGHQAAHIAIYDPEEQLILTGDTLYPGRLYISDFAAYQASIDRLVDYLSTRDVCWVMGTHVEMTQTAGVDFQFGADQHPDEHPLQLTLDHLLELQSGVSAMNTPSYEVHDDFIIYPL